MKKPSDRKLVAMESLVPVVIEDDLFYSLILRGIATEIDV